MELASPRTDPQCLASGREATTIPDFKLMVYGHYLKSLLLVLEANSLTTEPEGAQLRSNGSTEVNICIDYKTIKMNTSSFPLLSTLLLTDVFPSDLSTTKL